MAGEIIVGLDIGTTKICAVVGEIDRDGEPVVIGSATVPCQGLRRGMVVDIDETALAIKRAIQEAERRAGVEIRSVAIGVTGEHISSLNSRGVVVLSHPHREITEEDRQRVLDEARAIVHPPGRQILHVIPRSYTVDGHKGIRKPVGMFGTHLEVEAHIITANRSFVDNVLRCVEKARLTLDGGEEGIFLEALATAEAVLTSDEKELGVALVDIGGGTTDVALFSDGSIFHTAVIPVGGEHVTRDIAIGLRLAHQEAERVKLESGTALISAVPADEIIEVRPISREETMPIPRHIVAEIIEPRMEELFELLKKEIDGVGGEWVRGGLVITGGGSLLPGTDQLAERVLGMPARVGLPRVSGPRAGEVQAPPYATAVGLMLLSAKRHLPAYKGRPGGLLSSLSRWARGLLGSLLGRGSHRPKTTI